MKKPRIIVICGPTASGKTSLSIELAKKINGEIISCDSMQIYKDFDIGTAKPSKEEQDGIEHHLIDYIEPTKRYSVSQYKNDAVQEIEKVLAKGKVPIIVGGTGLYINSLVYNIDYMEEDEDLDYRNELEKRADEEGLESLYNEAMSIDEISTAKVSNNDRKRIIRILEIYHKYGMTKTELEIKSREKENPYDYDIYAIDYPREELYERINKRVDIMVELGLVEEVKNVIEKYGDELLTSMQAIGYKEFIPYFKGEKTLEEVLDEIKQESRHYAKRQITWFKRIENLVWLDGKKDVKENIEIIENNYNKEK